jgi:hypothetical protein
MNERRASLRLADPSGSTLLITLLVMLMVFALGSALTTNMLTEVTSSANYRTRGAALWQAEAGLERVASDLLADPLWARQMVDYSTIPMSVVTGFPTTTTINGMSVTFDVSGGAVVPKYYDLGNTVTLDDGSFTRQIFMPPPSITPANGPGTKAWLVIPVGARGTSGVVEPSEAAVRTDMRVIVRRLTVWDNALFGGSSQTGGSINGNVQVRGSMHIKGEPGKTVDMGGTAFVLNHYRDADQNDNFDVDWVKLPPVPLVDFNGEIVQSLGAEVRVEQGDVDLSGNVVWGEPDVTGNIYKEELDGVYNDAPVSLSGSAAINPTDEGDYDATGLAFPTLDDPYFDAATSTNYATHRAYLDANSLTIPVTEISKNTASFNMSNAFGSVDWNQPTNTLTIDGIVRIAGDLDLATKDQGLEYEGVGTLYATGDVRIHGHVMPDDNYLQTSTMTYDNLGIIADTDIEISTGGGETWVKVMAALYAEEETVIRKQSRIAGAVVTRWFDAGNNVPRIFQAANLSANLPPGMPGGDPMLFVTGADVTNWYHVRQ